MLAMFDAHPVLCILAVALAGGALGFLAAKFFYEVWPRPPIYVSWHEGSEDKLREILDMVGHYDRKVPPEEWDRFVERKPQS